MRPTLVRLMLTPGTASPMAGVGFITTLVFLSMASARAAAPDTQQSVPSIASCHMVSVAPDPAFAAGLSAGDHRAADQLLSDGNDAFHNGRIDEAAQDWSDALLQFRSAHDAPDYCETARRLAGAYQTLGNYRLAYPTLVHGLVLADQTHNDRASMRLCEAMGSVLTFSRPPGDEPPPAGPFLERSLGLARHLNDAAGEAAALNDLGNLDAAFGKNDAAFKNFADAATRAEAAPDALLAAKAQCNAALTAARAQKPGDVAPFLTAAADAVEKLDDSSEKASLLVTLGRCAQLTAESTPNEAGGELLTNASEGYRRAIDLATTAGDLRTLSYAWGYLGNLYEVHGGKARLDEALLATHRARFFAQSLQRRDAMYRWEWQSGRILVAQGDPDSAIKAYQRALTSLQAIRDDVALGYGGSAFRKNVGPMFYELADLLLQRASTLRATQPAESMQSLEDARAAVETLKATELKNYFQDECVRVAQAQQKDVDTALSGATTTAVLYVIPLEKRTEVLISFPPRADSGSGKPVLWQAAPVPVGRSELYATATLMRDRLEDARQFTFREPAAQIYDWVIRPILPELKARGIDTLVFVPDGELRRIPPAALYDSQTDRFLVEDFAIAITPGLTLISPEPIGASQSVRILAAGMAEGKTVQIPGGSGEMKDFKALPGVSAELVGVEAAYGARGRLLPAGQFRQQVVKTELEGQEYSIVHLASHAQFDQDARKTFVVADDGPLDLNHLEQLIEPSQFRGRPVELLTLSACETAAGDDDTARAALGLAGVAVRAGARSAMATLWLADDTSTSRFMPEFYRRLASSSGMSKARALQEAQVEMLSTKRYRHPRFWAPFIVIGNWR